MSGFGGIIGGLGGAIIGFAVGGPVGAQIGYLAGSMVGNLLDPPKYETPEPAMQKVQLSEYGRPIPILYGTDRFAGTVIWQKYPFDKHKETSGGKGTSPEVTSTTFSTSFAVLLCKGPIDAVLEVWADGRLVWPHGDEGGFDFTLYTGTEDQLPDPTMEAELGVGRVPAHRGYAYVVFTDLMLKDFGERIPSLEFLVTTQLGVSGVITQVATKEHSFEAGDSENQWPSHTKIVRWKTHWRISNDQLDDPAETELSTTISISGGSWRYWPIGHYLMADGSSVFLHVTPDTDTATGTASVTLTDETVTLLAGEPHGPNYGELYGIPTGRRIIGATMTEDRTQLFVFTRPTTDTLADTYHRIVDGVITETGTVDPPLSSTDLGFSNVGNYDRSMVSMFENNGEVCWFLYGSAPLVGTPDLASVFIRRITNGNFAFDATADYGGNAHVGQHFGSPNYDARFPSIYVTEEGYAGAIIGKQTALWTRFEPINGVPLSEIVADISSQTPLDVTEYDTSDLTDLVLGYRITAQMEARNAIQALRQAYFFDAAETQGVVKFVKRGAASVVTIDAEDLAARPGGDAPPGVLRMVRKQEADLPQRVYVTFINPEFDYQQGTEYEERQLTGSLSQTTIALPIVLPPATARAIAGALVWDAHRERMGFTFWLPRDYWVYDATDVMTVDGIDVRVERVTAQASGVLEFEGTVSSPGVLVASDSLPGGASSSQPQQPSAPRALTELVLLDIPILTQHDAPFGFYAAMGPAGTGPWGGATLFKSLDNGLTWISIASTSVADVIGSTVGALGDYTGDLLDIDEVSTVDVFLNDPSAELSSATDDAFDNGANFCAIRSGGAWEILQYRDAVLISSDSAGRKTYTLTGFYRGRKSTELAISGHMAADTFVLLPCINVDAPESELNIELLYKAVTYGTAIADATAVPFTNTGQASEEYYEVELDNLGVFIGDETALGSPIRTPRKGLVPAPALGDAALDKVLHADGTWRTPTVGGTDPTGTGFAYVTAGVMDAAAKTPTAATALLDVFVGDLAANGSPIPTPLKGLVPAPSLGDAAAESFLAANGEWLTPTGTGEPDFSESFIRYAVSIGSSGLSQVGFGFSTVANTPTAGTISSASLLASTSRTLLSSTSSGNTGQVLNSNVPSYWFGNAAGLGGFRLEFWWGVETTDTTLIAAIGLFGQAANLSANGTDPSTLTNRIFMGCDKGDTNMQIMHNDAAGTCTKIDLGASFPKTSGVYYKFILEAAANSSSVDYRVERLDTAGTPATGTLSTDLPSNTTFLNPQMLSSKGAVVTVISVAVVKVISRAAL